jgi:taurine dioxygenase
MIEMSTRTLTYSPVTNALGAVVDGVNLSQPMGAEVLEELRAAWLQYHVLFFRDQQLTNEQFESFVTGFGEIEIHSFIGKVEGSEIVERLENKYLKWAPSTSTYHIDVSMMDVPTKGAALYAIDVAGVGGDTIWVNTCAAYEALSVPMQDFLEGRSGLFVAMHRGALDGIIKGGPATKDVAAGFLQESTEHPLVHTHPETGKKALFVDALFMWSIVDMYPEESDALKNFLFAHIAKPEFQCRFQWQPGSVALWDNRCTMHRRVDDAGTGPRIMHRLPIKGVDKPRR